VAGAWEQPRHTVLTAILHVENTTVAWSFGLRNLIIPGGLAPFTGMPFDHARNAAVQAAIAHNCTHLFFLDSDVIPPKDAILRLLAHNKPIISGVYHRRSPPVGVPVMIKGGTWVTQYPPNAVMEVDLVGAGCLLLDVAMLKKMTPQRPGYHWFDWRVNFKGLGIYPDHECLSEDFSFCVHAKRTMNIPTLVDTSIKCRHVGYSESEYASFNALNTTPVT